jgi:hypothetical protein
MNTTWPRGWFSIDDPDHRRLFQKELESEVGDGHVLRGVTATPIARAVGRGDYLFELPTGAPLSRPDGARDTRSNTRRQTNTANFSNSIWAAGSRPTFRTVSFDRNKLIVEPPQRRRARTRPARPG